MIVVAGGIVFQTKPKYEYGGACSGISPALVPVLRSLWLNELNTRLERYIAKLESSRESPAEFASRLFAEANRLAATDLFASIDLDSNAAAISEESILIATEMITAELARHQLPAPPRLRDHAEALARNNAAILSTARMRVEAKLLASAALIAEHKSMTEGRG